MENKPLSPSPDEQVRPDELVRAIKKEPKDEGLKNIPVTPGNYRKFIGRSSSLPRGIFWGVVGLVIIFIGGFILSFYVFRGKVANSISENIETMRAGVIDLQNFDVKSAEDKFSSLGNPSQFDIGPAWDRLGFLFGGGKNAIVAFANIANNMAALSHEADALESSSFNFLVNGDGGELITGLNSARDTLAAIDSESDQLSSAASFAGGFSSLGGADFYLSFKAQLEGVRNFLDALAPWLADTKTHHVLVMFQNPSEIRPAGGFLGSYADVTLAGGDIKDISVHDIADVDAAFKKNIIPPKPLQLEVKRLRPADVNWFFDFPTSASKTIKFFEDSDLYAKIGTTFDAAIAVSPEVIKDMLSLTGPISLGKPTTTFDANNFLVQIQKIVQDGQATDSTYPKKILGDLSHEIFSRLASSTDEAKQKMLSMFFGWGEKKDIMVYFKEPAMQTFFAAYDGAGDVYELPQKFNGDYLALVDANVNGGKSDLYVSSTVVLVDQIEADGTMTSHLTITRKHNGSKSPYSWYKTTNQDYLQLFVLPGVTITNADGGAQKKIVSLVDYSKSGYASDTLISAIEATEQILFGYPSVTSHNESGKKVFATWSSVKAGTSTKVSFDYTHRLSAPPRAGMQYQFVFDKQAGTNRDYKFEIDAPLGFAFAENGISSYEYVSNDPPGRLVVNLTLVNLP